MTISNKVIESLANKYERVRKEVSEVMGGEILETEAKKILEKGREQGREEGREEGREQGREEGRNNRARDTAAIMLAECEPLDKIARYTGLPIELIEAIKAEKSAGN